MIEIDAFGASLVVRAIGFALIEFVWQGAAIGVVTAFALILLRRAAPQWRYGVACLSLLTMAIAPVATTAAYLREGRAAHPTWIGAPGSVGSAAATPASLETLGAAVLDAEPAIFSAQWLDPLLPFVVAIWSSGVALLALHLLYGWFFLSQIQAHAIRLAVDRWPVVVAQAARRFGLTHLRLVVSSSVDVPAVIGFFRPAIVVPASALAGLTPAHLEAIVLHELTHLRRGDHLVNVVQCGVEILLFYHPAVWWVSNQIRREREHCCDDAASALCADRMTYARALTSLEELRIRTPTLAVGADGGELLHRIRRLIAPQSVAEPRVSGGLAMAIFVTIALLALNAHLGSSPVSAEQTVIPVVHAPATVTPVAPAATSQEPMPPAVVPLVLPAVRPAPARRVDPAIEVAPEAIAPPGVQTQVGTGGLTGIVRDQTGAVVPGARVSVMSADRTIAPALTTNSQGPFVMADLPAGAYELVVSLPGFRTSRNAVQIRPGQIVTVIVTLEVGSLAEMVTVRSPSTYMRAGTPAAQVPANPQTASDFFDAAKILYEQGKMAEAMEMTTRARDLLRAARPEVPIEVTPEQPTAGIAPMAPVRVGGHIKEPRKIRHVSPIYPADAAAAGVEGIVVLEAVVGRDGLVTDLSVVRSVPMLDDAAVGAVQQWRFTPTLLNNAPIEVQMTVTVNFSVR